MAALDKTKIVPDSEYLLLFLSSWEYRNNAFRIADRLVDEDITNQSRILDAAGNDEILAELVAYLARSRRYVLGLSEDISVAVVFAVWREVRRLQPYSKDNPTGEDALRAKIAELEWLIRGTRIAWSMYIVDDGCPEGSLEIAQAIVAETGWENVTLLRLSDGLPSPEKPLSRLDSVSSSVKGGAILYGMSTAAKDGHAYVMFTDCDNSNNLGQIGLLLQSLREGGNKAAIGDRKGTRVLHWQQTRSSESESNYVLKRVRRLLDFDLMLKDVTCPFKMFQREYLLELLNEVDVFDFCVDYDILGSLKKNDVATGIVPLVSLDSELESTWTSLTNANIWWQKLRGFVHVAEKYGLPHNKKAADLVRERLWTLDGIRSVLEVTSHGVIHRGRTLPTHELLMMSVEDIDEWIESISVG
jgi:hypothetical protein